MSIRVILETVMDGLPIRVIKGSKRVKCEDKTHNHSGFDHRWEWLTPDGWRPVKMHTLWAISRGLYVNEDWRYPHGQGGEYFHDATSRAMRQHGGPEWQEIKLMIDQAQINRCGDDW